MEGIKDALNPDLAMDRVFAVARRLETEAEILRYHSVFNSDYQLAQELIETTLREIGSLTTVLGEQIDLVRSHLSLGIKIQSS